MDAHCRDAPKPSVVARRNIICGIAAQASLALGGLFPAIAQADAEEGDHDCKRWEPFELVTGDAICVAAKINGRATQAILDSGSGATVVSSELADELGLQGEARTIAGLASKARVTLVKDVTVTLGNTVRTLPFAIIGDLSAISAAMGRPVSMLLGADIFTERCIRIDFVGRRYSIMPSGRFDGGNGWVKIPLFRGDRQELLANVALDHELPAPMMIDTGNSSALMIANTYRERLVKVPARTSTALMAGVDGIQAVTLLTLNGLMLGGLQIDDVPAIGMARWISTSAVGNVGLPLLAQFDVVFDISRDRLWLRPLPPAQRLPMLKDRSGLSTRLTPLGLVVVQVSSGSPAARAGWVAGETIIAIDGKKVNNLYTRSALWRWRYGLPGKSVRLQLGSGQIRVLRLQTFY